MVGFSYIKLLSCLASLPNTLSAWKNDIIPGNNLPIASFLLAGTSGQQGARDGMLLGAFIPWEFGILKCRTGY